MMWFLCRRKVVFQSGGLKDRQVEGVTHLLIFGRGRALVGVVVDSFGGLSRMCRTRVLVGVRRVLGGSCGARLGGSLMVWWAGDLRGAWLVIVEPWEFSGVSRGKDRETSGDVWIHRKKSSLVQIPKHL